MKWFSVNKFKIGLGFLFLAGGFERLGQTEIAAVCGFVAAFLMGAGKLASDSEAKARR